MLGTVLGKAANTVNNLVLGLATSNTTRKIVGGGARGVAKGLEKGAGLADTAITKGQVIAGKAMQKETYEKMGKAVGDTTGKIVKNTMTDPESYKKVMTNKSGQTMLWSNKPLIADDMARRVNVTASNISSILKGKQFNVGGIKVNTGLMTTGGDNLLPMGMKATGLGVVAASGYQLASGTPQAVKQWNANRQGTNYDNQPTTSAPRVPAYANNGGATGDLVFALNNLRNGGMM